MRLWAYGVSPHGLGLPESVFWHLTPREFYVLEEVQQQEARRWATHQAIFANSHLSNKDLPFVAEDFLGLGDREERLKQWQAERAKAVIFGAKLHTQIVSAKSNKNGDDIPDYFPKGARNGR